MRQISYDGMTLEIPDSFYSTFILAIDTKVIGTAETIISLYPNLSENRDIDFYAGILNQIACAMLLIKQGKSYLPKCEVYHDAWGDMAIVQLKDQDVIIVQGVFFHPNVVTGTLSYHNPRYFN